MELDIVDGVLHLPSFMAVTIGIIVLFVGRRLNNSIGFLKEFSIPEPVSGGLLFSIIFSIVFAVSSIEIDFDLAERDILLVFFFTTIGINSNVRDLFKGGKPLIILLVLTVGYMVVQNFTGILMAKQFDMSSANGLLGGSVSLIGGHGTAIAWAPKIAEDYGVENAMEIGIACATFGLILASLMGGPIAKFLIKRHKLEPSMASDNVAPDASADEKTLSKSITATDFLDAILAIHVCGIIGLLMNSGLSELGLDLPLFVTCLFSGILITNLIPDNYPRLSGAKWPARTPAIALIAEVSLGAFLAMSLMSLKLWNLIDLAGPIFSILGAQFIFAILFNILIIFPAMGKNYDAAVVCSGFGGISLGSTPTAMANMAAVTNRYGNSHLAFIIVPLVCAFFIDLANALMIPFFLNNF